MNGEAEVGTETVPATPPEQGDVGSPSGDPMTFEAMGLLPEVKQALLEMGFLDPLPVQSAVFTRMMNGRDVMVQSRTGSGKTAAFGIPFAQGLITPETKKVQALCLAPTRELALQVAQECGKIGQYRGLSVTPIYGGAPMNKQVDMLKAGSQIVAGTPGRVLDHLRRGTLKLDALKVLVLDEADEMLSMGFLEEITEIIRQCPTDRQTTLFSATIPDDIERIGSRYMRSPEKIQLSADGVYAREVKHAYYMISGMGRARDLVRILELETPESAIIFCNTREDTNLVAEFLRKNGLDAEAISSDLTQKDRERVMGRCKAKDLKYLVATDIAARGIDITDLSHVINYTFPESAEVYVHRTGRTGRAGKSGVAISLISPRELGNFYMLKLTYKIKPDERTLPAPSSEQWKAVQEGKKVDELRAQLLGDRPLGDEWLALAKRVWASDDGEKLVAALIQDRLSPERRRVSDIEPQVAAIPQAAAAIVQSVARAPSQALATKASAAPAQSLSPSGSASGAAPASNDNGAAEEERDGRPRRARSRRGGAPRGRDRDGREARPASGGRAEGGRPERERGRSSGPRPHQPGAPNKGAETIDTSDGREFWEAWVDSKSDSPAPATAAGEAPAREPSEPREAREPREPREPEKPLDPGQVRLYLNLGRRDGLRDAEITALLNEKGVVVDTIQVRNSHTYLIAQEASEPGILSALNGQKHAEREIVVERARK